MTGIGRRITTSDRRPIAFAASATTSRVDAEALGGVMTEKLAELFAESATEEHALRPVRRRRLDSKSVGR